MVFLVEWLTISPGCFIVYPRVLTKSGATAFLESQLNVGYTVTEYTNTKEINKQLKKKQIVLFDDVKQLSLISEKLKLEESKSKLIVLTTWGDKVENLEITSDRLQELALFYLDIVKDQVINWNLTVTPDLTSSILENVTSHWPEKQVVLSSNLTSLLVRVRETPYEENEIFVIMWSDEYEVAVQKLRDFNSRSSGLLFTSVVPFSELKQVSTVHLSEATDVRGIFSKCKNKELCLEGHFPERTEKLQKMFEEIREVNRVYQELIEMSPKLVLSEGKLAF